MIECQYCEMKHPESCERAGIVDRNRGTHARKPWTPSMVPEMDRAQVELPERCPGCEVAGTGWHHPGCEWDMCSHNKPMRRLPGSAEDGCRYIRPLTREERWLGKDSRPDQFRSRL